MGLAMKICERMLFYIRQLIINAYFSRITVYNKENIPDDGLVIFVCNHRNGAIDGYTVTKALSYFKAVVGKNLTGSLFLKFFFGGHIEIYRSAETIEERAFNQRQLKKAAEVVKKGTPLLIFPEGTSKLGPSLLPIKKGAAFICKSIIDSMEESIPVYIVPIGLHYQAGWMFRSRVEIHFGQPVLLDGRNTKSLTELTNTIKASMTTVTANFDGPEEQKLGESLASFVTYYNKLFSHLSICRMVSLKQIPDYLVEKYNQLVSQSGFVLFNGAPIIKPVTTWKHKLCFYALTPLIMLSGIINFVPLFVSYLAAGKMADDSNVVTLWKILLGTPLFIIQWIGYIAAGLILMPARMFLGWIVLYLAVSLLGLWSLDYWRRLGVVIRNNKSSNKQKLTEYAVEFLNFIQLEALKSKMKEHGNELYNRL